MGFTESLIFYLLIGLGVAAAVWIGSDERPALQRLFPTVTAVLFWPLYVPVLLSPRLEQQKQSSRPASRKEEPGDCLASMIRSVEAELDAALASLDGWAEAALSRESIRIEELKATWSTQAARIREMDRLLTPSLPASGFSGGEWPTRSEEARRENLARLAEIRRQAHDELTATLAWVRELVSMIHLAKFSGAPAARAEELVARIAAAVEGISEVTNWRDRQVDIGVEYNRPFVAAGELK